MAFPTVRQIVATAIRNSDENFERNAVNKIVAEVERRVARKPDIQMIPLLVRVMGKYTLDKPNG